MRIRLVVLFGMLVLGASGVSAQVVGATAPLRPTCKLTPEQVVVGALPAESLSVPVKPVSGPAPRYPNALRVAGVEGKVTLHFVVDTAGKAEACSIMIVATTDTTFNQPSINTILGWVFSPGLLNGVPVRALISQSVVYKITR